MQCENGLRVEAEAWEVDGRQLWQHERPECHALHMESWPRQPTLWPSLHKTSEGLRDEECTRGGLYKQGACMQHCSLRR